MLKTFCPKQLLLAFSGLHSFKLANIKLLEIILASATIKLYKKKPWIFKPNNGSKQKFESSGVILNKTVVRKLVMWSRHLDNPKYQFLNFCLFKPLGKPFGYFEA